MEACAACSTLPTPDQHDISISLARQGSRTVGVHQRRDLGGGKGACREGGEGGHTVVSRVDLMYAAVKSRGC